MTHSDQAEELGVDLAGAHVEPELVRDPPEHRHAPLAPPASASSCR
jgi:hypothetical protein